MIVYLTEGDIRVRALGRDVPVLAIATSIAEANEACEENNSLSVIRAIDHSTGTIALLADRNNQGAST